MIEIDPHAGRAPKADAHAGQSFVGYLDSPRGPGPNPGPNPGSGAGADAGASQRAGMMLLLLVLGALGAAAVGFGPATAELCMKLENFPCGP